MAGLLLLAATAFSASCDAPASNEDLNPAGPPMVRQVLVTEKVIQDGTERPLPGQLAFGSHSDKFFEIDDGVVQSATVLGSQEIRIILDEQVRGNTLEEVACQGGSWSRIPNGTTPDDMAACSGPPESLIHCTKVCMQDPKDVPAGEEPKPLGILDENGPREGVPDGAPDKLRMINYSDDPDPNNAILGVILTCDGIPVALDPNTSFWNPSGNQTFPSNPRLGFRGLGPAIVAQPLSSVGLRSGANCVISFRPEVVDYDGNRICAPEGGDITNDCADGDTTRLTFGTEPLKLISSAPVDGATKVSLGDSIFIFAGFNANIDVATLGAITLTAAGVNVPLTPNPPGDDSTSVVFDLGVDFTPSTEYVMTIGTDLADKLGGKLAAEETITWTTKAFGLASSTPSNNATKAATDVIVLDFNGTVDPATLGSISMTKDGTKDPGGEPAADGVAVAIAPTLDPMDASKVLIDLGDDYQASTYYEVNIGVGLKAASGAAMAEAKLLTWTTEALALKSSTPANNSADVAVNPPSVVLTFNTAVSQASVTASMSLTANGAAVIIGPTVQADAREVSFTLASDFISATEYVLTITTALTDEAKGDPLLAETTVTWTTAN